MKKEESIIIAQFHSETSSADGEMPETPATPPAATPPPGNQFNPEINYNVMVGDKDGNGYTIEDIYHRVPGNYIIYGIQNNKMRIKG